MLIQKRMVVQIVGVNDISFPPRFALLKELSIGVGVKMAYPQIKLATTLNDAFGS